MLIECSNRSHACIIRRHNPFIVVYILKPLKKNLQNAPPWQQWICYQHLNQTHQRDNGWDMTAIYIRCWAWRINILIGDNIFFPQNALCVPWFYLSVGVFFSVCTFGEMDGPTGGRADRRAVDRMAVWLVGRLVAWLLGLYYNTLFGVVVVVFNIPLSCMWMHVWVCVSVCECVWVCMSVYKYK